MRIKGENNYVDDSLDCRDNFRFCVSIISYLSSEIKGCRKRSNDIYLSVLFDFWNLYAFYFGGTRIFLMIAQSFDDAFASRK